MYCTRLAEIQDAKNRQKIAISAPWHNFVGLYHHIIGTCVGDTAVQQFFPIVDACLSCEDMARQSCAMVRRSRIFGDFCVLHFSASRVHHISDLLSKFALGPHHVYRSMVDIESATTEIRRGKKEERKKERDKERKKQDVCGE